jgi:hypothetical protein
MSHSHVELYLLQGLYVPFPCETLFIALFLSITKSVLMKIEINNNKNGRMCPWDI